MCEKSPNKYTYERTHIYSLQSLHTSPNHSERNHYKNFRQTPPPSPRRPESDQSVKLSLPTFGISCPNLLSFSLLLVQHPLLLEGKPVLSSQGCIFSRPLTAEEGPGWGGAGN